MRRNAWLLAILLIALLLGVNNTIYYFTTKDSLEDSLEHEMESVAKQIEISIELSRGGAEKYQEQIGRELRAVSIATQFALSPDVEKVSNSQLAELSKKLDMVGITLLKRTKDNIILYKSSSPKQLGYKTNTWKPWYQAFNQLFDEHKVTIDWGQHLTNFWTGPFEFATTDTSSIQKWGYYYDGTTNYMIDPYISYDSRQHAYDDATGVDKLISQTLKENKSLSEITIINPETFGDGERTTITDNGEVLQHMTQNPIINGTYKYEDPDDLANVKLANEKNIKVYQNDVINGKHVIKLFIPVDITNKVASMLDENGEPLNRYVISLVSDYATIQRTLDKQFVNIAIIIGVVTAISLILVYLFVTAYRKSQDKLVRKAQETYLDEINGLFQSIRSQRHDFANHVQTIHALAKLGKTDELKSYTAELTGEIRELNDIIDIGNPAIAALIRAKGLQAEVLKVAFKADFKDINKLELGMKSLDMTRLLGNLIDNAFDEVLNYAEDQRSVHIAACQKTGYYEFAVSNTCLRAAELENKPLFQAGYTSKKGSHSGLGLHIVKSIVEKYKGGINLAINEPNTVTFIVKVPY
ncbi:sensor histidine kinase [Paenibacillus lignilyticus]|uniref:GHKL domain-containing protein n=1 Tax=Paenibacillus lignilyticus TaxID=1172615 RepID=A0ABS5C7G2_9BACL|nr:GHKL domain-containing protein [Paenibacillus lignilyticus]MBP3961934.1 GHKL domain-containing protein [Paenibacillus lignilyticus]